MFECPPPDLDNIAAFPVKKLGQRCSRFVKRATHLVGSDLPEMCLGFPPSLNGVDRLLDDLANVCQVTRCDDGNVD